MLTANDIRKLTGRTDVLDGDEQYVNDNLRNHPASAAKDAEYVGELIDDLRTTEKEETEEPARLFEISRTGDPYNRTGWDVREYQNSFDEDTCVFRGDLSPMQGRDRTIRTLRRMYPGCKVRVQR